MVVIVCYFSIRDSVPRTKTSEAYFYCRLWVGCSSKESCREGWLIKVIGNHGEMQEDTKMLVSVWYISFGSETKGYSNSYSGKSKKKKVRLLTGCRTRSMLCTTPSKFHLYLNRFPLHLVLMEMPLFSSIASNR